MTLDEMIKHAEEVAESQEYEGKKLEENGEKYYDEYENYCASQCFECAEEHRQLAEWLKELKQLKEQTKWISVSKRLPEKSGNYYCTFGGTNLTGNDYYTIESDAKELFDNPEEFTGWQSHNVIAWMPFPKPYKPQESEDKE